MSRTGCEGRFVSPVVPVTPVVPEISRAVRYSGYTKSLAGLPAGAHYFGALAVSSHNGALTWRGITMYVDSPTVGLTIDRPGTGTGGVTASGLSCPGGSQTQAVPCGATYPLHTVVTLTAAPDVNSTFAGWGGACTGTGTCQVTLSQARFVVASFTKLPDSIALRYYHTDVIGSVRAITDEQGYLDGPRHDYRPFGEDVAPLTGDPNRFTGKQLDAETALHYFDARYYRQTAGRFTSVDPLQVGAAMTEPQRWNRYAYAGNNPLKFVDPSGLSYWYCGDGCHWFHGTWDEFQADARGLGLEVYGGRQGGVMRSVYGHEWTYDYHCYVVCDWDDRPPGDDTGGGREGGSGGNEGVCPACQTAETIQAPKAPAGPFGPFGNDEQKKALKQGKVDLKERMTEFTPCGKLFYGAGFGSSVLDDTTYRFIPLPENPGAAAGVLGPRHIAIVPDSAYMTGIKPGFLDVDWDIKSSRSFILGHELGHQVGRFGKDRDPRVNQRHSQAVIDACGY